MSIQILLADDHTMIRQSLRTMLEMQNGLQIIAEAADGLEAVRMAGKYRPDVAILDLSMPGLNGIDAGREIRRASKATKVLILTVHAEASYVLEAMRSGFAAYVLKTQSAGELVQAIHEVRCGKMYLSPGVSRTVIDAFRSGTSMPRDPLSAREREVLQLVAEGKTTKEIGTLLGVSVKTADSHRTRIMKKLDIHATARLVRYAIRRGLVSD